MRQNSPKSLKTCYPIKPPPISCQISSRPVKPPWRKPLLYFLHPSIFWLPRWTHGPKVTGLGGGVHQPLCSYLQNFVTFRRPLTEISAAKLRRFCCAGVTLKNTVNDNRSHRIIGGHKKEDWGSRGFRPPEAEAFL